MAEILRERQLHPDAVFITHLHPDHTSGVADLPADVDYVFDRKEAGFLARAAVGSHFSAKPRLKTLDYAGVAPMPPLGPALELLRDGSLWAISTAGHTSDHTSYLYSRVTNRCSVRPSARPAQGGSQCGTCSKRAPSEMIALCTAHLYNVAAGAASAATLSIR